MRRAKRPPIRAAKAFWWTLASMGAATGLLVLATCATAPPFFRLGDPASLGDGDQLREPDSPVGLVSLVVSAVAAAVAHVRRRRGKRRRSAPLEFSPPGSKRSRR